MDADVRIDAEASFKESILHNPHNVKAMLGLATLHRLEKSAVILHTVAAL